MRGSARSFYNAAMRLHRLLLTLCLLAPCHALAQERYTIDPLHTFPSFEVSHLGFSTQRGRFNTTRGSIVLDREKQSGSIDLEIDAASIDMGVEIWNQTMRGEDFFNTRAYPVLQYRSEKLLFSGQQLVGAEGSLTLLGVSRPLRLTVSAFKCGTDLAVMRRKCGADVEAEIRRSEFGMEKFIPFVGDQVRLRIAVEAFQD